MIHCLYTFRPLSDYRKLGTIGGFHPRYASNVIVERSFWTPMQVSDSALNYTHSNLSTGGYRRHRT